MQSDIQLAEVEPSFSVLIVDDHPLYSDALATAMEAGFASCEIRRASTMQETFAVLDRGADPDLIVLDLKLPDVTGISGFQNLRQRMPHTSILVVSSLMSTELVHSLIEGGAMGFLPKESPATPLRHAVREIRAGRRYVPQQFRGAAPAKAESVCSFQATPELAALTPQQTKILKLICAGKPNKQIAYELSLAEATVKAHITALLRRLGVRNRTQAVVAVDTLTARQAGHEPEARAFLNN